MPKTLKILFITTGYPRFNGDVFGCFIEDIAKELSKRNSLTILAPYAPGYPWREQQNNIQILRWPYFFHSGKVAYGAGIPSNLKNWSCRIQLPFFVFFMTFYVLLLGWRYDILHAHWGVSGWFAWPAARLWRKKLVLSFHGSDLHGAKIIQKTSRAIARKSHANICVSQEQANHLGSPCQVISYGIDTQRFCSVNEPERILLCSSLGLPQDKILWLYVGYFIPLKRVHLIVEALAQVSNEIHLVIVGDGPCYNDLKNLAEELACSDRVHFCGSLPYHHIHQVFQVSHLHLLVSEREGKPNVIFQAMACGVPSMATPVGGIPEQIDDGQTGWLIEGKPESIINTWTMIEKSTLLTPKKTLANVGSRAQQKLKKLKIDSVSIAEQHQALYLKLFEVN